MNEKHVWNLELVWEEKQILYYYILLKIYEIIRITLGFGI